MTDEQIIALAKQARQKYCDKYNEGIDSPSHHCEDECCPLYRRMYRCGSAEFYVGFFDGFKAAAEYINQIPHFPLKNDSDIERIEKFRDNPELCQTYLRELKDNIECMINGILAREK